MNFQDLKKIENDKFYLDVAFKRAKSKSDELRNKIKDKDRLRKSKTLEIAKLEIINSVLAEKLNQITTAFPSLDQLDIFYLELIKCTLDYKDLKKSLGSVKWAVDKIRDLFKQYRSKIQRAADFKYVNKLRREYYGRVSSVLKQIKKFLNYLEESRKTMKGFPAIKTSMFTVCITGFPNAGKSTLLKKMTSASPEINSYAFTTKKLNLGYIKTPKFKIQVIDTPGTLNRQDKMNYIELQAYLAVKHLANLIVYVFDPSLEYSLDKQERLLKRIEKYEKPILIYLSKQDIADKDIINKIKEKHKILEYDELNKELLKKAESMIKAL